MGIKGWNVAVLLAIATLWCASSTQRQKQVVGDLHQERVALLEDQVAASPASADEVVRLGQAYLDAHQPGMAIAVIERSPDALREEPTVTHLYARALLDQGRSADALAAERRVLARCAAPETEPEARACSSWLVASATRRADILEQLVQLGIEDANAHPEASNVAYHTATRQVTLSVR